MLQRERMAPAFEFVKEIRTLILSGNVPRITKEELEWFKGNVKHVYMSGRKSLRCPASIEESYSSSNRRRGVAKSQNAATGISHDAVGASDSKILSTVPLISTSQTRNERNQ